MKKFSLILTLFILVGILCAQEQLSAWNQTSVKAEIISYVEAVVDSANADFVPISARIAVFDLDGTLMCEKPNYILSMFSCYAYSKKLHQGSLPILSNFDKKCLQANSEFISNNFVKLLQEAFVGISQTDFMQRARDFMYSQEHTRFQKKYAKLYYEPMAQLVTFLQDKNFKIYICSGSDTWYIRSFSESLWNILPQNVIGTELEMDFKVEQGRAVFKRGRQILQVNNRSEKAENLFKILQTAPLITVGNSAGDLQMLLYATSNKYKNLNLLVKHDDKEREYRYLDDTILQAAKKHNWTIISIKSDFKQVFPD